MKKLLPLVAALVLPASVLAEAREERVAVAKEYVELALADFDMTAVVTSLYQPILQQVAAAGQTLSDDQIGRIRQLYLDTFTKPMIALMREQSGIMADVMTLGEITALRDFYATPEGRSVMAKLPQMTAAQQPGIMKLVSEKMGEVTPQVLAIINGEAPQGQTAPP